MRLSETNKTMPVITRNIVEDFYFKLLLIFLKNIYVKTITNYKILINWINKSIHIFKKKSL